MDYLGAFQPISSAVGSIFKKLDWQLYFWLLIRVGDVLLWIRIMHIWSSSNQLKGVEFCIWQSLWKIAGIVVPFQKHRRYFQNTEDLFQKPQQPNLNLQKISSKNKKRQLSLSSRVNFALIFLTILGSSVKHENCKHVLVLERHLSSSGIEMLQDNIFF